MLNNLLLKYNKYKFKFFSNFFFLFFLTIFFNSINFLEEDLFIGIFSNLILGFLVFFLRELKSESARQNRKRIKIVFRLQRDLFKRYYFKLYKSKKRNFKYIKKIAFDYFLIKSTKIFIKSNLKLNFFYNKKVYNNVVLINETITFIKKITNKLLDLYFKNEIK